MVCCYYKYLIFHSVKNIEKISNPKLDSIAERVKTAGVKVEVYRGDYSNTKLT